MTREPHKRIHIVDTIDDRGGEIFPEESQIVASAVASRRSEFASGRWCAHRALERFGMTPTPISSGPSREPLWPPGFVGSITHCAGYRAAAVAQRRDYLSIGIDAELHRPLPDGILDRIASEAEKRWIRALSETGTHWDTLLFSAKESVYKAWFPLAQSWLGFDDATITVDPEGGTFHAELVGPHLDIDGRHLRAFDGTFEAHADRIFTMVSIPNEVVP